MEHKVSSELPPIPSQGANPEHISEQPLIGQETASNKAFEAGQAGQSQPPTASVTIQSVQSAQPVAPQQISTNNSAMPGMADDTDLIEKEWVDKAKEIVARTKHDPYVQNKEVERMKADYMKKRYDKDIKITED